MWLRLIPQSFTGPDLFPSRARFEGRSIGRGRRGARETRTTPPFPFGALRGAQQADEAGLTGDDARTRPCHAFSEGVDTLCHAENTGGAAEDPDLAGWLFECLFGRDRSVDNKGTFARYTHAHTLPTRIRSENPREVTCACVRLLRLCFSLARISHPIS
jgi:hypothetical protein